jgi:ketosteroid isomerase-like protein
MFRYHRRLSEEAPMSQQNIALVQSCYAAFGRGDIDALLATLDPDIDWTTPGGAELPYAGARRGITQVRQFFNQLNEFFDFELFEPQTFLADGDRVVVLGQDRLTVKATGKSISEAWCHVMTIRNGKIVTFQEYIDTAAVAAEFKTVAARA